MLRYVTHQFAHPETLTRAERWLLQLGFTPGEIEAHREGVPWISVLAAPDRAAEALVVINAAEHTDPKGWPSFWELARMPHVHAEPPAPSAETRPHAPHRAPLAWHPPDDVRAEAPEGLYDILDAAPWIE
jgi:hypothetical protein